MAKAGQLPDADRLSILTAIILLAYALVRLVDLPVGAFSVSLPGVVFSGEVNLHTVVALLVAGLTASGADWLLRDHPSLSGSTIEHWILPALTAWVIGIPLFQIPLSPLWWIGFSLGGSILLLVLVAEYIAVDPTDMRHPIASVGLTAVSFALFLALSIALRFAGLRLFLLLPALALGAGLASLRSLHLRLSGRWTLLESAVIAVLVAQIAAGLHYLPIQPVSFSLFVLAPAYALTSLMGSLLEGQTLWPALAEPLVVLAVVWAMAFLFIS